MSIFIHTPQDIFGNYNDPLTLKLEKFYDLDYRCGCPEKVVEGETLQFGMESYNDCDKASYLGFKQVNLAHPVAVRHIRRRKIRHG